MNEIQHLYYALGQMAYAIAKADGSIQSNERELFRNLMEKNLNSPDFDISEIIFRILEDEDISIETSSEWALKEIKNYKYKLTNTIKNDFISFIDKVAASFPPVTETEKNLISKFKHELDKI